MSGVDQVEVPGLAMPAAHYAHATVGGGMMFISGILPDDVGADITGQTTSIFLIMQKILGAQGLEFDDVAKLTIFVKDISDRRAIDTVRKSFFKSHRAASTLVQIGELADPAAFVEIEAVAFMK
jgi:enamine deaminase RidA (YjgF/YER057c/UK114 family)